MAKSIINVSIYNEEHKQLLKKTPNYSSIEKLVKAGLEVDEDLWVYCLFTEQQNRNGYRDFDDFKIRLNRRMCLLEDYLDMSTSSINVHDNVQEVPRFISEYIGVGTALKLISEIHGLTEADWKIIPESNNPDLDFEISSNGENIFEVECKGTFNDVSRYNMKMEILTKKEYQRTKKNNNHYLYGVITSYFSDPSRPAHAYLLDPEPVWVADDPEKFQIITRLRYYLFHLNSISKSHLLTALANRISDLDGIKDFRSLSKSTLKNTYGETIGFPVSLSKKINFGMSDIFGDVVYFGEDNYLFIGFVSEVVNILIGQDFDKISSYRVKSSSIKVNGDVKNIDISYLAPVENSFNDKFVTLSGILNICSSGRIIGRLNSLNGSRPDRMRDLLVNGGDRAPLFAITNDS